MRHGLLSSLLKFLVVGGLALLELGAWAQRVAELRTGTVELSTWLDATATGDAVGTRSAAVESGSGDSGDWESGQPDGALGLYLVAYTPGPDQLRLRGSLTSRGARLLSYVPHYTWLVAMTAAAAAEAAAESGAAMAPLGPPHRIDPEWQPLLRQVEAAEAEAAAEVAQRRRRRRGRQMMGDGSGSDDKAAAEESGGDSTTPAAVAALAEEVGRRAARVLSQLQPLAGAGRSGASGGRRRRQAHEQQQQPGAGEEQEAAGPPPPMYGVLVSLLSVPQLTPTAVDELAADWPTALAAALGLGPGQAPAAGAGAGLPPCWPVVEAPRGPSSGGGSVGGSSGPPLLQVHVCPQHLPGAVSWLSGRWQTQWLEPQWAPQLHNAVANVIGHTGGLLSLAQYTTPLAVRKPYWEAGLDGAGEVVGVTDTGVDMASCYFSDPRYMSALAALAAQAANNTGGPLTQAMPEGRKVVAYSVVKGAAYGDPSGGHGTHTSGTVAGAVPAAGGGAPGGGAAYRVDNATGAAPGALLSVIDISTREGGLTVPPPMDRTLMEVHANAGVRITSDSWGILSRDYTAAANDFDRYLWSHDDHVALVAAGNYGQSPGLRSGQVTAPAVAKNVIAVGASLRSPPFTFYYPFYTVRGRRSGPGPGEAWSQQVWPLECRDLGARDFLTGVGGPGHDATLNLVALAEWVLTPRPPPSPDPPAGALAQQGDDDGGGDAPAAPPPGSSGPATTTFSSNCGVPPGLAASGALAGAVVVAPASPNCSLVDQVLALQRAGAAAALLGYTEPTNPPTPVLVSNSSAPLSSTGVTIPVAYITQSLCSWLLGNMSASSGPVTFSVSLSASQGLSSVASFSSAGPALDGRIKPDIVAPGFQLTSAWRTGLTAGDTCGTAVASRSGTSMSTPTAAGHTALMRQYLRTGFYPTGSPADAAAAPFTPSGMLLKALVIAGAKSLEGGEAMATRQTLGPPPDAYQGWGRLSLAGSLPLPGLTPAGFSLQVADRGQFTASGQTAVMTGLTATGDGPISIVLTWYDYVSYPNALVKLVNDLDLAVTVQPAAGDVAASVLLLGNNPEGTASPAPDRTNTVERVYMTAPPPGAALTISVRAHSLPSRLLSSDANYTDALLPQRWAVAVVGHFSGTLASELNPAYVRQGELGLLQPPPPPKSSPPRPRKSPPPSSTPPPTSPSPASTRSPSPKKPGKSPKPPPPSTSPSGANGPSPNKKKKPPPPASAGGSGSPPPPPKKRGRS